MFNPIRVTQLNQQVLVSPATELIPAPGRQLSVLATSSRRRSPQHLTHLPAPSSGNDVPDNICWSSPGNSKSSCFGNVLYFQHQEVTYRTISAGHPQKIRSPNVSEAFYISIIRKWCTQNAMFHIWHEIEYKSSCYPVACNLHWCWGQIKL